MRGLGEGGRGVGERETISVHSVKEPKVMGT